MMAKIFCSLCSQEGGSFFTDLFPDLQNFSTTLVLDLLQVSLAAKTGEGIKARETCNTWQSGSLAGQDSVQSASFYKKPISNHMLRKYNDTTERGSAMIFDNGRLKFDEIVDNNPVIFENGSKTRLLMNINEHAKYYKYLSLFFLLLFFPRERLVASPPCVGGGIGNRTL